MFKFILFLLLVLDVRCSHNRVVWKDQETQLNHLNIESFEKGKTKHKMSKFKSICYSKLVWVGQYCWDVLDLLSSVHPIYLGSLLRLFQQRLYFLKNDWINATKNVALVSSFSLLGLRRAVFESNLASE